MQAFKEWALQLDSWDVAGMLDISWSRKGFINGDKVVEKLKEFTGDVRIEDLPIPFTAVATDLKRNREFWFQRGSLLEAVRASISIPSIFTPVAYRDMILVDGGVLNPLPVAPTMADDTDLIIASNVYGDLPKPEITIDESDQEREEKDSRFKRIKEAFYEMISSDDDLEDGAEKKTSRTSDSKENLLTKGAKGDNNPKDKNNKKDNKKNKRESDKKKQKQADNMHLMEILDRTYDTMQDALIRYRLGGYPPDITIDISKRVCNTLEFHKAQEVIEAGRLAAEATLAQKFRQKE
jgi:NTE family protein